MNEHLKYLSIEEILAEFEYASADLRGSGARGRARLSNVKEELIRRLEGERIECNGE